jgi:carboxylesterase type B
MSYQFFTFSNIRFGKSPTGTLRFNVSTYPEEVKDPNEVQDSNYGPICHQINTDRCDCPPFTCPKDEQPESPFLVKAVGPQSEDCLFLDLYVPKSAFEKNISLPVIVWFHGGSFLFGAKDTQDEGLPLYKGDGILQAAAKSKEEVIFVVPNYRLGLLGWLAGPSMEDQAVPNAGLYDQRLVLEWVQDFVHLVKGDKTRVSAWGESAGASSIMHHLVAHGGARDPLFSKAVVLSPGFEWQWDRTPRGKMEQLYKNFTDITGCVDEGLPCLRELDGDYLARKSQELYDLNKCSGVASVGPAVDGDLIHQLPAVELAEGHYWKHMDSLIISHVADEASSFVPKFINEEDDLDTWLNNLLPHDKLSPVRNAVERKYDQGRYGEAKDRASAILQDAFFICNTRQLYDAYNDSTTRYVLQYSFLSYFGLAVHASDLLPIFWNKNVDVTRFIKKQVSYLPEFVIDWLASYFGQFAQQYQRYLVSHATSGDPNTGKNKRTPKWKQAKGHNKLKNVMETSFSLFENYFDSRSVDSINTASVCNFWTDVAKNVSAALRPDEHVLLRVQDQRSYWAL